MAGWTDLSALRQCRSKRITKLEGKSTRPGVYKCQECEKPFSVTVGTVFERSHIPLNKWLLAMHLMTASKKGMSAHQLHRTLGMAYQSAWFMCHRIREAMKPCQIQWPVGGKFKTVEVDETYVGGKATNRKSRSVKPKTAVVALVQRDGDVRSFPDPQGQLSHNERAVTQAGVKEIPPDDGRLEHLPEDRQEI